MGIDYYIFASITVLFAFILPIGAAIFMVARKLVKLRVILAGMAVFIIFQPILRILPMSLLQNAYPQLVPQVSGLNLHYVIYGFILSLTAGIYEEGGRFLAFTFILKKYRGWHDGLGFGIGHGGAEALIFVGISAVAALFTNVLQPGQSPWLLAVGGVERLSAMTIQVGLTLLVLYSIRSKKYSYLLLAVGLHWLVDFVSVMFMVSFGILVTEISVGLFAAASLVWIIKSGRLFAGGLQDTKDEIREVEVNENQ